MAKGPAPKRQAYKHGHHKQTPVTRAPSGRAGVPDPDPDWHPRARQFFAALTTSGQSRFYEASDWSLALVACDVLSRMLSADKVSPSLVSEFSKMSSLLLVSEADRRRAHVELGDDGADAEEAAAEAAVMDAYRRIA